MIINVDVSFFGHPTLNGLRVETCYVITENGAEPLCPEFEEELLNAIKILETPYFFASMGSSGGKNLFNIKIYCFLSYIMVKLTK